MLLEDLQMIVVIRSGTQEAEISQIINQIRRWKVTPEKSVGKHKVVIGLVGDTTEIDPLQIQEISPCIEQVLRVKQPFKRASLESRYGQPSEVVVPTPNGAVIFGQNYPLVLVAGPCAVENEQMIVETAQRVKAAGAQFLRGGAYKPRTSPYAFQGHGDSALDLLAAARAATGLGIITEIMDVADLEKDTLDLSVVPVLRSLTHLPIMIDPSHGTGRADYVPAMAMAAITAGADSLMIEVHPNPAKALSDGPQSLTLERFEELMQEMAVISKAVGRWTQTPVATAPFEDVYLQHCAPRVSSVASV